MSTVSRCTRYEEGKYLRAGLSILQPALQLLTLPLQRLKIGLLPVGGLLLLHPLGQLILSLLQLAFQLSYSGTVSLCLLDVAFPGFEQLRLKGARPCLQLIPCLHIIMKFPQECKESHHSASAMHRAY